MRVFKARMPSMSERRADQFHGDDAKHAAQSDIKGFIAIFRMAGAERTHPFGALAFITAASVVVMVSSLFLGSLIEGLTTAPTSPLMHFALLFLLCELIAVVCQYVGRTWLAKVTVQVIYQIRLRLFDKLRLLPMHYFDQQPMGRTITRLTHDVDGIETFFSGSLARLVTAGLQVTVVLIAMLLTDRTFGPLVVAVSLPALIATILLRAPVRYWMRAYRRRGALVNATLAEYLSGFALIRLLGLEAWASKRFVADCDSQLEAGLMMTRWNSFIRPLLIFLCSAPTFIILWRGSELVQSGAMSLGVFVAFVRYSERFLAPIRTISQEVQQIQEALVSLERVRQMLGEIEESAVLGPHGSHRLPVRGSIRFENVWMRYGEAGNWVLRDVSFAIPAGAKVGLVGATGSGKTTVVSLLSQLYPHQAGSIYVDDLELSSWDREELRRQCGLVTQDVVTFTGTLRDNLRLGLSLDGAMGDDQLHAFCRQTGFSQFVERHPEGLEYRIEEGGRNLSVGERQLLALTRMLIRDPRIVILDEATASIDATTERAIQGALETLTADRTCLTIAHRLNTVMGCDLILVFHQGALVECGSPLELMASKGSFSRLAATHTESASLDLAVGTAVPRQSPVGLVTSPPRSM